jgi:hypothetical protein
MLLKLDDTWELRLIRYGGGDLCRKIIIAVVLIALSTIVAESAQNSSNALDSVDIKGYLSQYTKINSFPVLPDYIKNISYDVRKTESEIALLSQIEESFNELSEKLDETERSLLKDSQLLWIDYYEKETYGLNPANDFVVMTINGDKKRINAYRENLKAILEGREFYLNNLINNQHEFPKSDVYQNIFMRIKFFQARMEYLAEERNRPRVYAGEEAWKRFLDVNDDFLKIYFADDFEKINMYNMYTLKERLRILELQVPALEMLRKEVEL